MGSVMGKAPFEVLWGPIRTELVEYVQVIDNENGWLHVQPLNESGEDDGEMIWLSPGAVQGLRPWKPKTPKTRTR